jgi:hypothetical protein
MDFEFPFSKNNNYKDIYSLKNELFNKKKQGPISKKLDFQNSKKNLNKFNDFSNYMKNTKYNYNYENKFENEKLENVSFFELELNDSFNSSICSNIQGEEINYDENEYSNNFKEEEYKQLDEIEYELLKHIRNKEK